MWYDLHCPEYRELTIEEKLLVNAEMKKWHDGTGLQYYCAPMFLFKEAERRVIIKLKEENGRRKHRNTDADA